MRIVVLIHSMHAGGAERVTATLVNAWAERGWHVTVLTMATHQHDFYKLHPSVTRIPLDLAGESGNTLNAILSNLMRIKTIRRVFHELRPNIVLGMMTTSSILALLAGFRLGFPIVVSERTYPPMLPVGRLWDVMRRLTYPWAARVVMLTREGMNWLNSEIPRARGVVIPNPVIYPLPSGEPRLPVESMVGAARKLLLAVGRLDEGKQFNLLLEAFSSLAPKHPDWDLAILGEGPQRSALEERVKRLGLEQRARLPGRAGNVGDWYSRADLYVMSSRFEGFPNTLAEAMAHGCAAVSYDCDTGPRDIIRDGVDGLLVSPEGGVPALTDALDRLMGDEKTRNRMAEKAGDVRERFSMERILAVWDALLDEVYGEGRESNKVG